MIRLALVGMGGYGWHLAGTIRAVSARLGCRLIAAADIRLNALADKAARLAEDGVELFDDPTAMFTSLAGRCDAVYIATSIHSHCRLAISAARAGLHLHLEKPPAATVQEVDDIIRAVEEANVLCLVGFHNIQADEMRWLQERVAAGRLGKVTRLLCASGWPRKRAYYTRNDWAGRLRVGGNWVLDGPITNAMGHEVMEMLYLAGNRPGEFATPTAVRAELYAAGPIEAHDTAAVEIRTAEGPTAYMLASHCTQSTFLPSITVEAEAGTAFWNWNDPAEIRYADGKTEHCRRTVDPREAMVANFIEAIRRGDGSLICCGLHDARKAVLAVNAAHESSGRIHRIDGAFVRCVDEGTPAERTVVVDLDRHIQAAGKAGRLLSDLAPRPPWAVATAEFPLDGYSAFGQQFQC